ncbi:DUF2474 domain-containing protein [Zavarzinia sp. CC-PAN008]
MAPTTRRLWGRRIGWMVVLWAGSIAVLGVVALGIRLMMNAAGLTAGS